jgi:hypothetical protein
MSELGLLSDRRSDGSGPAPGKALVLALVALLIGAVVLAKVPRNTAVGARPSALSAVTTGLTGTTSPPSTRAAGSPNASAPPTTRPLASTTSTAVPATHPVSSVKVVVSNGTSTKGLAGTLSKKLAGIGYDVLAPTNTTARATAVYYAAGYQGDALAVANSSGIGPNAVQQLGATSPLPAAQVHGAQVIVIIGPDLASSLSG